VPKIDAPTVAEHHARRRAAIIGAAADLLGQGPAAVTPAAVAGAAGLARSSVYQYYPSTGALLGAAVEETFARALAVLDVAMQASAGPRDRVVAYLDASLAAALAGHLPQAAYAGPQIPQACLDRVAELHAELVRPLVDALRAAGVTDPAGVAGLINGAVSAAATQVQRGEPLPAASERLRAFVLHATGQV